MDDLNAVLSSEKPPPSLMLPKVMDAEEIFANLAIRHIDLQLMLFALLELKEGLSEFPTTNYLHYLHAANHFEAATGPSGSGHHESSADGW